MKDFRKNTYAAVIGGLNIDICGRPHSPIIDRDSNPGTITTSVGGVGRNIAHNLCLLGVRVKLLTALGSDAEAGYAADSCDALGIDISHSRIVSGAASSRYMFITDDNGDMRLAVNDMSIYENMTPDYIDSMLDVINGAGVCIADANIPQESLEYLAENCSVPLIIDPVSAAKSYRIKNIIGKLHTLKPNIIEAKALTGIAISDKSSLGAAADKLVSTGLERVFITMGKDGVLYADKTQRGLLPCLPHTMVNTTGAGDSFTAAAGWALMNGLSIRDTAKAGLAASAICLESAEAVNKNLSCESLLERSGIA